MSLDDKYQGYTEEEMTVLFETDRDVVVVDHDWPDFPIRVGHQYSDARFTRDDAIAAARAILKHFNATLESDQ